MVSLKKFFVDLMPGPLVRFFARPYVGSYGMENAIKRADEFWERGISSTMDLLGEFVKTREAVENNLEIYFSLMEKIKDKEYISISIKLSAFGLLFDQELMKESMEKLVKRATELGIKITLDMEDSNFTDLTLDLYKELLEKYPGFGTVLQSRLFRTEQDVNEIIEKKIPARIRMVIGIYIEPSKIAYTDKKTMKEKLLEYSQKLYNAGCYTEFATHDVQYIKRFLEIAEKENYDKSRIEFQHLLGVPLDNIQKELVEKGYTVRLYVPFAINKGDATAYLKRRLIENPKMAFFVIKNIFKRN